MSEQKIIHNCKTILQRLFPGARLRILYSQGGLLVEVVHESINSENAAAEYRRVFEEMIAFNGEHEQEERFVIHKLFLYSDDSEKYRVAALLHVKAAEYDSQGIFTSYLSEGDARVWMSELDAEGLIFGVSVPFEFLVFTDIKSGMPLAIRKSGDYRQIGFQGVYRQVTSLKQEDKTLWKISVG